MRDWVELFTLNTVAPFFVVKAFTDLLVNGAGKDHTSCVINISAGAARLLGSNSITSVRAVFLNFVQLILDLI